MGDSKRAGAQVQVALREWNFNVVFAECSLDGEVHVAGDRRMIAGLIDPHPDLQIDG